MLATSSSSVQTLLSGYGCLDVLVSNVYAGLLVRPHEMVMKYLDFLQEKLFHLSFIQILKC